MTEEDEARCGECGAACTDKDLVGNQTELGFPQYWCNRCINYHLLEDEVKQLRGAASMMLDSVRASLQARLDGVSGGDIEVMKMVDRIVAKEGIVSANNTFGVLAALVMKTTCKPGWAFRLQEEHAALRLVITVAGMDSYNTEQPLRVAHFFPVPTATYNEKTWRRWIFECCRRVENHELGEWFMVDGKRPFAPLHGPGEDPYTIHEFREPVDAQTIQDGTVDLAIKVT